MAYYWKNYRNPYRRRFWYRRWGIRRPFQRRRRRRRYRVRKTYNRKLPKITVRQFQPPAIRKCFIKGRTCLIYFSPLRLGMNSTMYEQSIVPDHWPGGGSFSVTKYTLENLYDMHLQCRNWWTTSNEELPLCRYIGCKVRFYQCNQVDYAVRIQNTFPALSNKLTYPSCQPSMLLMSKGKIVIPSKQNQKRRKPYKTVFIKPPEQLKTEWYFQRDMLKCPLFVIHATTCSLDNYFLRPNQKSNNCTFNILNTSLIQNRNMLTPTNTSWPYKVIGTVGYYMWYSDEEPPPQNGDDVPLNSLIPLTNPREFTPGYAFNTPNRPGNNDWTTYLNNILLYQGNPFHPDHINNWHSIYISQRSPEGFATQVKTQSLTSDKKWKDITDGNKQFALTKLNESLIFKMQYTPNNDSGQDNEFYLLKNTEQHGWEPPDDPDLKLTGFPLWLGLFGFTDFEKKLKNITNIDTKSVLVFKTTHTFPKYHYPMVILSDSFLEGHSPYEKEALIPDKKQWCPMYQYQIEEQNKILNTGPGIPYITTQSENVSMYYQFYFKWGGSPPKDVNIHNPALQNIYPIPGNQYEKTSLQNPAQPPETLLYSFDNRHGKFTDKSLKRITENWETETFISSITEPTSRIRLKEAFQELQQVEEAEEQKEAQVQQQLISLRHQQQCLRQHIAHLISKLKYNTNV
nr:MAG: ORF1 [TTV-like mini virus]